MFPCPADRYTARYWFWQTNRPVSTSIFELFKVGIGPSSSHTVGPMLAAGRFMRHVAQAGLLDRLARLQVELFGSLGLTGRGHGSDKAIVLGLMGHAPDTVPLEPIGDWMAQWRAEGRLPLPHGRTAAMDPHRDLLFHKREQLEFHPNGMRFTALDAQRRTLCSREYFSVGGGFVLSEDQQGQTTLAQDPTPVPHPYRSAAELLELCRRKRCSIARLQMDNETAWRSMDEVRRQLLAIWSVMRQCIQRGMETEGELPGGLKVPRRAPALYADLCRRPEKQLCDQLTILDWVNLYALAVSEENAAGGRVVTAPTNGAAGILPAALMYLVRFCHMGDEEAIVDFLLTAGAIGLLYKMNASISGAEVGCQGEVGVACSMAAAGLCQALGGTPEQVENAAEIAMEHHLGMTCDPIGGLVQIPCIERNAMAAVKAINAQRLAMRGDGLHFVSLDKVIRTMRETGADMQSKYKETSRGGLAVNVVEC